MSNNEFVKGIAGVINTENPYIFLSGMDQIKVWVKHNDGSLYVLVQKNGKESEANILPGMPGTVADFPKTFNATTVANWLEARGFKPNTWEA